MNRLPQITAITALVCVAMSPAHCVAAKQEPIPPTIDMPAPAGESGNTYARAMSAVLSHLGADASYDRVMGLTGVAFILQVDTSGPFLPDGQIDAAWWPNDPWGFELGLPVLSEAVGWRLRKLTSDLETYRADPAAEYRRAFARAIDHSLRAGTPVLATTAHCFIVTSVDDQEPPLLGYGTRGKSTQFLQDTTRIDRYPWGLYVIGGKTAAGSSERIDLASLRHITALFNERAQGPEAPTTRFSGRQAWAEWLRLLREAMTEGDESKCGSAWDNNMLIHLRYNRRSAVAYLRDMAGRHTGKVAEHLGAAADLYQRSLNDLMKGEMPHPGPTKGGLPAYAAMVERVSRLEAEAIAELGAAGVELEDKQ